MRPSGCVDRRAVGAPVVVCDLRPVRDPAADRGQRRRLRVHGRTSDLGRRRRSVRRGTTGGRSAGRRGATRRAARRDDVVRPRLEPARHRRRGGRGPAGHVARDVLIHMRVVMVSGPAGAGKSTLGRALAAEMRAALLDLDDLTNPILDAIWAGPGHWNDLEHRPVVRPARYSVLRAAAAAQVAGGVDVVLVAPFTAELAGGDEWAALIAAVAPAEPFVVWIDAPADVLAARVRGRAAARGGGSESRRASGLAVSHLRVDGLWSTTEMVGAVRAGMV